MRDSRLERWLAEVVATPGLTGIRDLERARLRLLDDSVVGAELITPFAGPIVDVGSGAGVPGIPLAAALPAREVTLLEANGRKCEFLERWASEFTNLAVRRGRAEEQERGCFGVAVARALAPPVVAVEWCLPLVTLGGAVVLWVGPTAEPDRVARAAEQLGGRLEEAAGTAGLLVIRKVAATPQRFPRRPGVARKRPLA